MSDREFNELAIKIFELQYELNPVYREFVSNLNSNPDRISNWEDIPCLPISFFKTQKIVLKGLNLKKKFISSGTTGQVRSTKYLSETQFYESLSKEIFEMQFGDLKQYSIFALLPSYLENNESSLVHMIDHFINISGSDSGGFYNRDFAKLIEDINEARKKKGKIILWGVSFALLDLAEKYKLDLSDIMVFETGGMKGRKKEITREELHQIIREKTGAEEIFSEYGMTEMMSQAYSFGNTKYRMPNTMRIQAMELNDPMSSERNGRIGSLNIIDLGNIETCSFIATEDLGRVYDDGTFEVLGRKDNSEIRGCNLMSA
ncbi:MAG: acyl transferase [Cytophagales bacterium]